MAYSSLLRLSAFALAASLLLGGCCANNVCNCNDAQEDTIRLRFQAAPPGGQGFVATDVDTIIIQRYPKKFTNTTTPETVTLLRPGNQGLDSAIVLSNTAPFAQAGTARLNQYRYVVQYLQQPTPGSKPVATTALVIDSVLLRGEYDGSGCCTCYRNTAKMAYLHGKAPVDARQTPTITISK